VHREGDQDAERQTATTLADDARVCANPACENTVDATRGRRAAYCTPACNDRVRSARYRATPAGRARAANYRRARRSQERERASNRRAAAAAAVQAERLERLQATVNGQLPRTAGQIEAVRRHIADLTAQLERATEERDAGRDDARQLARLARHLFLTTGAPGFDRAGIQELFATYLTAADRRQVPAAHADVDLAGLGIGAETGSGAAGGERRWR
jgi:septal ring factor EnvC (AmiA/AmiB activator)